MECAHSIIEDGFCTCCGEATNANGCFIDSKLYNTNNTNTRIRATLEDDLQKYALPADVKEKILELYGKTHQIVRKQSRKILLSALTYQAYISLNKQVDVDHLKSLYGLTNGNFSKVMKLVSGTDSNINIDKVDISISIIKPESYFNGIIGILLNETNYKIERQELDNINNILIDKAANIIYSNNPKNIAVAILKYYLDSNNIPITNFYKMFDITSATINKSITLIKNILEK